MAQKEQQVKTVIRGRDDSGDRSVIRSKVDQAPRKKAAKPAKPKADG